MEHTAVRCLSVFLLALACGVPAAPSLAQTAPAPNSACIGCHRAQASHQAETAMARALLLTADNPTLRTHPKLILQNGSFSYTIETQGGQSTYTVSDGTQSISVPVRWAAGERMQTFVLERNGHYYESRVSYYAFIDGLQITVGQEVINPRTVDEALGRQLSHGEARNCFGCHASGAVVNGQLRLSQLQGGVTCEHCHTGATEHLLQTWQGIFDSVPRNLKTLSSEEVSSFCGQCHRSWETVIRNGIRGVRNVRFQPYRLENSKCFNGNDPRISCIACHDPHQPLVHESASYDSKCLACHATSATHGAQAGKMKSCPVASTGCTECHMPKVNFETPAGVMTFTDHDIRLARPGDPYPN